MFVGIDAERQLANQLVREQRVGGVETSSACIAEEPFELTGVPARLPVTVSIGVAEHSPTLEEHDLKVVGERLLALADVALYEAKAGGRNTVARAANS